MLTASNSKVPCTMSRPTIRTIAEKMGLSNATISLALRGHPRIPRETCERVAKTAREVGYMPNPSISKLMTHIRSARKVEAMTSVAFLNANQRKDLQNMSPYHQQLQQGIEEQGRSLGYRVESFWLKEKGMTTKRMNQILESRGIQGLIIPPIRPFGCRLSLNWESFSAVTAGYSLFEPRINRLVGNQRQAIYTCIHRLLQTGHKRIGLVCHRNFDSRLTFITSSVYEWFQKRLPSKRRIPLLFMERNDYSSLESWIRKYKPDGVLSHIQHLPHLVEEIGYSIPKDISVVIEGTQTQDTKVSGCYIPPYAIGERLMKLLDSQLLQNEFGIPDRPFTILMEMQWEAGTTMAQRGKPDKLVELFKHTAW